MLVRPRGSTFRSGSLHGLSPNRARARPVQSRILVTRQKALAALEPLNKNTTLPDASPISTRNAEDARRTAAQPEPEPAPRDHTTAAGTVHVTYGGSVRSRLITAAKKRDESKSDGPTKSPEQLASDQAWFEMEMKHRERAASRGGFGWGR